MSCLRAVGKLRSRGARPSSSDINHTRSKPQRLVCFCRQVTWAKTKSTTRGMRQVYERLEEIGAHGAEARAGAILAGLSFEPDMQCRATKTFSGGWRMRIAVRLRSTVQELLSSVCMSYVLGLMRRVVHPTSCLLSSGSIQLQASMHGCWLNLLVEGGILSAFTLMLVHCCSWHARCLWSRTCCSWMSRPTTWICMLCFGWRCAVHHRLVWTRSS